jgi:hypothetical protein
LCVPALQLLLDALEKLHYRFAAVGAQFRREKSVAVIAHLDDIIGGADVLSAPIALMDGHRVDIN